MSQNCFLPIFLLGTLAAAVPLGTGVSAPVITPPPPEPTISINCHYEYCDGSTSWCFYWAGVSSYDPTLGPLPGESRTSVGTCEYAPKTPGSPPVPAPTSG